MSATLTNTTHETLRLPDLGRALDSGETVEVEDELALRFAGHPHIEARLADGSTPPEPDPIVPKQIKLGSEYDAEGQAEVSSVIPVAPEDTTGSDNKEID